MGSTRTGWRWSNSAVTDRTRRVNADRNQQFSTERASRIWDGDREAATSVSKTETEDPFHHIGCKNIAKSVLCGASSDSTCVEHGSWSERLQDYAAHEQQSGGSDTKESSATVRSGIRLPIVQVDEKTEEKWKPHQCPVDLNEWRQ
jgi:hypothetical protein